MFRLMYRQRRRIFLSAILTTSGFAYAFAFATTAATDIPMFGMTIVLVGFFAACIAAAGIFVIVARGLRSAVEIAALSLFLLFVLSVQMPEIVAGKSTYATGAVLFVALYAIIHGPVAAKLGLRFRYTGQMQLCLPGTPEELWYKVVDARDPRDALFDPLIKKVEPLPHMENARVVTYDMGPLGVSRELVRPLSVDFPHHEQSLNTFTETGRADFYTSTLIDTWLKRATETQTLVTQRCAFYDVPLSEILAMWLDDRMGSEADYLSARAMKTRDWSTAGYERRILTTAV